MFDILGLEIENFRSYTGHHEFSFPTEPGLYLLTGRNEINPRLGANGTGKSTLLDSIFWCLYGRTPRGLKAMDVVTWGKKSCCVSVTMKIGNVDFVVTRTQNPNSLRIESDEGNRVVEQDELSKLLRLTDDQFLVAVMMPQFGESFFDLSPSDKLTLFSDILNLDYWVGKSNEASELARDIDGEKTAAEHALSSAQGATAAIESGLEELREKQANFEVDQLKAVNAMKKALKEHMAGYSKWTNQLDSARACVKQADDKIKRFEAVLDAKINEQVALYERHSKHRQQQARYDQHAATIKAAISRLQAVGALCPVCNQTVDAKHLKRELSKLTREAATLKQECASLTIKYGEFEKEMSIVKCAIDNIKADIRTVTRNKSDFEEEVRRISTALAEFTAHGEAMKKRIEDELERINPFDATITQQGQRLTKLRLDIKNLTQKVDSLGNELRQTEFWVSGFKRVRLFLIESTLQELELEVNNNLGALGLGDWRVEFDVERENKSGGITKGFTVMVLAPGQEKPVPLAAWSGGETQRLRMAGDLGLANLIMEHAGLTNTIEMYDEPSRHLSQAGMQDLVETLADRAEDTGRRVLVIDHNTLDSGGFKDVITVVKDASGSHFE